MTLVQNVYTIIVGRPDGVTVEELSTYFLKSYWVVNEALRFLVRQQFVRQESLDGAHYKYFAPGSKPVMWNAL